MSTTWSWAGGKWWKFDFHSHTPSSVDYGKHADNKQISPQEWLLSYMRASLILKNLMPFGVRISPTVRPANL